MGVSLVVDEMPHIGGKPFPVNKIFFLSVTCYDALWLP